MNNLENPNIKNDDVHVETHVDMENVAIPEVHIEDLDKVSDENDELDDVEVDYSGAMPEIHIHQKK